MSAVVRVLSSLIASVQDLGRSAMGRYGVPVSGAMDPFALMAANRLVGNPPGAAAIEITAGGASFEVLQPTVVAVAGADLGALLDDQPLPLWTATLARAGAQLHLTGRRGGWGARAYLALAGGIDAPEVLGARAAYLPGGFGGLTGRSLRPGDLLAAGEHPWDVLQLAGRRWPVHARPPYGPLPALRILPGPHLDHCADDTLALLQAEPFRLSRDSDRMGYRFDGARLRHTVSASLPSLGVVPGALQAPPDGIPILLMADAQTTGGYPIVAVVIGADLPLAAQLLPGDALRFIATTMADAYAARRALENWIAAGPEEEEDAPLLGWAGG